MTNPSKRRTSSVEHRSTKRRKSNHAAQPIYSTRVITWEEQLTLPPRFHADRDVWPALKILQERGVGKRKEYLVYWEAHPKTGEVFEPTWEPADNVADDLKQDWKKTTTAQKQPSSSLDSSSSILSSSPGQLDVSRPLANNRRLESRRIIPDSSAEVDEVVVDDSAPSRTPTLTGSPGSAYSVSLPVEISETQQPLPLDPVRVNLPPAPADKSDWESRRESQISNFESQRQPSSPHAQYSNLTHQTPTEDTNNSDGPTSILTASTRPSLRSRTSEQRDRAQGLQRILDYQSSNPSLISDTGPWQYSTAPPHQAYSGAVVHSSDSLAPLTKLGSGFEDRSVRRSSRQSSNNKLGSTPSSTGPSGTSGTQPWLFKSQLPIEPPSTSNSTTTSPTDRPTLLGRCARKTTSDTTKQGSGLTFQNSQSSSLSGMATRGTRQSPRLQTVTPHSNTTSPRIAVRTNSFRGRSSLNPPEHSSPLAATAEIAEPEDFTEGIMPDSTFVNNVTSDQVSPNISSMPPTSIAPSAMHIDPPESSVLGPLSQDSAEYDSGLNTLPMPLQESIEEELVSPAEETSLASKASSSQESLRNERLVPRVDGLVMPTYPILGNDEYAIALPAEGKVQAMYTQTIKVKKKAILKFIRRRGSVNTASTSTTKTVERNEMIELVGRLHDTTTHIDLGLPGTPTQYTMPSQEHAAYAEYAGSKFVFLGYLMDYFKRRPETIVIMAKPGATQDLLEEYLYMKNVRVRRYEREHNSQPPQLDSSSSPLVELLSTRANNIVRLSSKPSLIIAFDASFEALDPQVKSLRSQSTEFLPIVHLMIANSSEHVERCLPPSMPSPIRLRLLVRATYQAQMNLGGSPTIITNPTDELDGRPMDLADISRAVRKSPNRRLQMVAAVVANATLSEDFAANWTLSSMPELALDELEESPSTGSTVSTTPGRSRNRSQTPVSRATTPSARKRQLEVDTSGVSHKRQRMTPVTEVAVNQDIDTMLAQEQELHRVIDALRIELANERKARELAEEAKQAAEKKAAEWQSAHALLQHRYEKRTKKSHEQQKANKSLILAVENSKQRVEKVTTDNVTLRQQVLQQKKDLEVARADLKSAGGDVAVLEVAREEARNAVAKMLTLDKSLENNKRDFEFLRSQYQDASNRAADLGNQVKDLETRVADLSNKAGDERRRLKELNNLEENKQNLARIAQLESERRNLQVLYKKLEDESKLLKRNRGVQTRGSSTAPGTPGQRSRQGSPALGNPAPPTGSRASVLRHEK